MEVRSGPQPRKCNVGSGLRRVVFQLFPVQEVFMEVAVLDAGFLERLVAGCWGLVRGGVRASLYSQGMGCIEARLFSVIWGPGAQLIARLLLKYWKFRQQKQHVIAILLRRYARRRARAMRVLMGAVPARFGRQPPAGLAAQPPAVLGGNP